jgi:TonB family protein
MNRQVAIETWTLPADPTEGGFKRSALSLLLGTGVTLGLFLGIAYYERGAPATPPPDLDDLRVSVMPMSPPPVPVTPKEPVPEFVPMQGFEYSPAESPVSIAVSPPDLTRLLPEDLSKAPPANAQINLRLADFKPQLNLQQDSQYVYQRSEVDQAPAVLERPNPQVSSRVRDNAPVLQVKLLVVIDANGVAGNIRLTKSSGNREFDQIMVEYIKEWVFSPAMKGGRKVRCLVEQGITIQWRAGSPFET